MPQKGQEVGVAREATIGDHKFPIYWNHFHLTNENHLFGNVSSGSSQGKHLLDTDDSQFSDNRLAKVFFSSLSPNTIPVIFFHHFVIEDPRNTN